MKRICGFAIFFIAVGILVGMMLKNTFIEVLIVMLCLLLGYNLFCC